MNLNRREFLTVSALTGVVGAAVPTARAFTLPDPPQKARLRLSCQEGIPPGKTLADKLDFMEGLGFEGLELGGRDLSKRVASLLTQRQRSPERLGVLVSQATCWRRKFNCPCEAAPECIPNSRWFPAEAGARSSSCPCAFCAVPQIIFPRAEQQPTPQNFMP